MYASKTRSLLAGLGIAWLLLPAAVSASTEAVHDPHRLTGSEEFQETIEKRCTVCHTRERVDQALSEGQDLDTLLQRMIERGAILNERDQNVLGTFWGSPTKGDPAPTD